MRILFTTIILAFAYLGISQNNSIGVHEQELMKYNSDGHDDPSYYEALPIELTNYNKVNCNLNKIVYGWHPYWVGSAYQNYQWDLLSHFSFFSYEVDQTTGNANTTHAWSTSSAVDAALASGNTKVTLCVTMFSNHTIFLTNATSKQTLITNLINLIQSRGAHGVNIDFEGLPSAQTTNFANFMVDLSNQMHTAIPGSEVSTVLYAVDWNNVFDFSIMEPAVDHYIIMGYAYYYAGSGTAGPTDPLYHFGSSYNYTLSRSITYYLDKGCPKNKLVLGLPEYGYEWSTSSAIIPYSTTANGTARTYAYIKNNTSGNYSIANHQWESDSYSDAYVFNNGSNRQCFISQDDAWRKRLSHVLNTGIAGIGIWALGYDNGYTGLWGGMNDYLTDCYADSCSGVIHDFGGPTKNYYNDEDYTWTIAPTNASSIDVDFTSFDVELNYDYLYVYDGSDASASQISGSPFTGLAGPGQFTTSTGAVTFRFTSDGATVAPGFNATYSCNTLPEPVASFSTSALTICLGDSVQLTNTSSDGTAFLWSTSTGGLSNSSVENPYLFANATGSYDVTLIVNNATGTDTIINTLNVVVEQLPIANATSNGTNFTLGNATVYFTNTSSNASSYFWNFADGATSIDTNPWHTYSATGSFDVVLVAMNNGCPNDTLIFTIIVGTTGVTTNSSDLLSISPNPFTDKLTIHSSREIENLILIDSKGSVVSVNWKTENKEITIEGKELSNGFYILELHVEDEVIRKRIVKQ